MTEWFRESPLCPFCRKAGQPVLTLRYRETAEANAAVPDIEGRILSCERCGVCYPAHAFELERFTELYAKSLRDLVYLDDSVVQKLRRPALKQLLRMPATRGGLLASALQVPIYDRSPQGLSVLDVGCGFGEFSTAYRDLGANVTATEIIPQLAERVRRQGIVCHVGQLEDLALPERSFDLILFRAVLYRTADPARTIAEAKRLLKTGGRISVLDPFPGLNGVAYFAHKQYPQGRYYIVDEEKFDAMLKQKFGLTTLSAKLIYGRPNAALLRQARFFAIIIGFAELFWNNLTRRKPYMRAYLLADTSQHSD